MGGGASNACIYYEEVLNTKESFFFCTNNTMSLVQNNYLNRKNKKQNKIEKSAQKENNCVEIRVRQH